jgi:hypothetical protein
VCQILEIDDEWNILKCTLHSRRVQKISITLAKLEEFLMISIFHETKIPTVDMKVQVYSKFRRKKNSKKKNCQNLSKHQPASGGRPLVAGRPRVDAWTGSACLFKKNFLYLLPPFFAQLVNSCWLAPAHARPGQTLPKNFKHP